MNTTAQEAPDAASTPGPAPDVLAGVIDIDVMKRELATLNRRPRKTVQPAFRIARPKAKK